MAHPVHNPPGDDVLTAYLDGELDAEARRDVDASLAADAETRARLEALKASGRPFKDAFQLVTDAAPRERLGAMIAAIVPPQAERGAPRRVWMSAAAVVLFASGVAIGTSNVLGPSSVRAPTATVVADNSANKPAAAPVTLARPVETDALQRQAGRAADQAPPALGELAAAPKVNQVPAQPAAAPATTAVPPPAQALADASPARNDAPATPAARAGATSPAAPPPPSGLLSVAPAAPMAGGLAAAPPVAPAPATTAPAGAVAVLTTPTWRQVVSDYIVLTTAQTLAVMPDNPRLGDAVAAYGDKLQLDLTGGRLTVPMASLKDVRLYDYRGRPLVEASFLSDDKMSVVSLCIILTGQPDAPFGFEQRNGQNIIFWTAGGHGFMLAGRATRETLEAIARDLSTRFS
jgi:hypothetical protein